MEVFYMNAKFCPKCGNELKEGAKFCPKCGAQIVQNVQPNGANTNGAQNQNAEHHKCSAFIIYFVI